MPLLNRAPPTPAMSESEDSEKQEDCGRGEFHSVPSQLNGGSARASRDLTFLLARTRAREWQSEDLTVRVCVSKAGRLFQKGPNCGSRTSPVTNRPSRASLSASTCIFPSPNCFPRDHRT